MDLKKSIASGIVHALEIPVLHQSYSLGSINLFHSHHRPQRGQSTMTQTSYAFLCPILLHSTEEQHHQFETFSMMSFYQIDT